MSRRRRTPSNNGGRFSLEDIHRSLSKVESVAFGNDEIKFSRMDLENSDMKTMQAVTSEGSTPFEDALHEYSMFARPAQTEDLEKLVELVARLSRMCDSNAHDWKIFILVAFRRRYHAKAPAAKAESTQEASKETTQGYASDGDGERLIFYVTCLALHRYLRILRANETTGSHDNKSNQIKFLKSAIQCMVKISPDLGGTRDVNAMIEHLCFELLLASGYTTVESPTPDAPDSFKNKIIPVIKEMICQEGRLSDTALDQVLNIAASLLDRDLNLVCSKASDKTAAPPDQDQDELLSTIHVTLPHNHRGSTKGKAWQRNMVNSIAELLIWQRTSVAISEDRFSNALAEMNRLTPFSDKSISDGHDCVLRMQTTARKRRKLLNDHARNQGFMLCSSYLMDKSAISLRLIRKAKAGDLAMLTKLAQKHRDQKTLQMILKRNLDPSKATFAESIDALISDWMDIRRKEDEEEDTIEALELQLQAGTVRATVEKLRSMVQKTDETRRVTVANIGHDRKNQVCAILIAAALHPNSCLLMNSKECDVSTEEAVLELLNRAVHQEEAAVKDQKTIQEILSTQIKESEDVVFLSSSDLELGEADLKDLQEKDIRIRVHSTSRVQFSKSIKIELNSEIHERLKAGAPLSLALMLDCTGSMGSEISGCKKGALALIRNFNDLAPVKYANFLGYWDPISSRGDPDPRSTGYLAPNKKNLDTIQEFVNTQLPCTGGGDEPEDIPAALEKLIEDVEKAGLDAEEGVHFVFFIADAGFRPNAQESVMRSLEKLKKLGVVMVLCPVRKYGTCQTLVAKNSEVFMGSGQYIELSGVGQLEAIATTVTESIRASLFKSGNVVSVTASVGQTMDAICQLCSFQRDHVALKKVEELAKAPEIEDEDEELAKAPEIEDEDKEDSNLEEEAVGTDAVEERSKAVFVRAKEFKLTSKDRLFLQVSRLPTICHEAVEAAFGGKTLQEQVASVIAQRLVEDDIPVLDLHKAGYPRDVVELVREVMGGHGRKRALES